MASSQWAIRTTCFNWGSLPKPGRRLNPCASSSKRTACFPILFWARFLTGLISAAQKDFSTAQKMADEFRNMVAAQLYDQEMGSLRGCPSGIYRDRERGNYAKAVSDIEKALTLWPAQAEIPDNQSWPVYHLGLAHFRAGNMEKARKAFEDVTEHDHRPDVLGRALSPRASTCSDRSSRRTGDKAKAIENYTQIPRPLEGRRSRPARGRGCPEAAGGAELSRPAWSPARRILRLNLSILCRSCTISAQFLWGRQ